MPATPAPPVPTPPAPPAPPAASAAVPAPPPSPPSSSDEATVRSMLELARTLGLVLALLAGVLFLLLVLLSVVTAIFGRGPGDLAGAAYCLLSAVVNYLIWREVPSLQALVGRREFGAARDRLLLWAVLGVLFFVIEGIVLLLAWLKLEAMARTPGAGSGAATCPRCGGPLAWVPEHQRSYCGRCGSYV